MSTVARPCVLNPYDEYAVEEALRIKEAHGGEVTAVCMGPETATDAVRKALAMGADKAVLVSDPALAGSDVQGTAYALAEALKTVGPTWWSLACAPPMARPAACRRLWPSAWACRCCHAG